MSFAPEPDADLAVKLNAILDWAEHRASEKTKEWLVPAGNEIAAELARRG